MSQVRLFDRSHYTENVRLRDGKTLCVRLAASDDAEALQRYFRQLSARSRYNRFLGAISELPASQLDHFVSAGENGRFTVTASMMVDDRETIVGEARYGFEAEAGNFEFGISIDIAGRAKASVRRCSATWSAGRQPWVHIACSAIRCVPTRR